MDTLTDLVSFLHDSPTPFHAVQSAITRLEGAGFRELRSEESWSDVTPGPYYVVQGGTTCLAFVLPGTESLRGFRLVGAHTDSPNLRLKPKPEYTKEGYAQLGVEVYGGALLNSWLDRDLALAGRVFVRGPGGLAPRLIKMTKPLLRVPQLAIHLDREVTERGLTLNKQEHLAPVFGLAGGDAPDLIDLCARELGIAKETIANLELMLYDVTPPAIAGARNEFLFSARLDNLAMCHAAVTALSKAAPAAGNSRVVPVVALFDHEEVGSQSATGAQSALLPRVLERLALRKSQKMDDVHRMLAGSLCVSADMAHAVHPNYAERHEPRHRPVINGGPVIKVNAQQRYATSAATAGLFQEICREANVPFQHYAHRTDLPCGSTIGPITSTLLGIPTVDVGNPMLSMHSAREMSGTQDPELMTRVLARFLAHDAALAAS